MSDYLPTGQPDQPEHRRRTHLLVDLLVFGLAAVVIVIVLVILTSSNTSAIFSSITSAL